MKLALAIFLARYLAMNPESIRSSRVFYLSFLFAAVPVGLTLIQPDLGTSLVLLAVWAGIAFVAGGGRSTSRRCAVGAAVSPLVCASCRNIRGSKSRSSSRGPTNT